MNALSGATALVTGATGFLGGALSLRLVQEGAQVKALARRSEKASYLRQAATIEIVTGDINDAARMREVMIGCDYVFHVAAALGGPLAKQRKINVDGTHHVMLAAAEANVKRVIHVSTIAVYGYSYRTDVTEDMPQKSGPVPYNLSKSEGESIVREIGAQRHLSYSIVRPGMIYGPRSNGWTATAFKLGKRNPTPFLGDGSGAAYPIYIDDLVDLMVQLATHPKADGEAFNCSADPAPTWREFVGGYSRLAGHNHWFPLPILPFRILAPLIEFFFTLRGEPQDLPTLIPFMLSHKTYKMTKARDLLGWQPKVSLQEGINRCVPWLREQGLLS